MGHLIAHHSADTAPIFETSSTIAYGKRRSLKEHFVDAFASVLLLPKVGVATALGKIRQLLNVGGDKIGDIELLLLARIFGVSFEVAARRCEDLELLPTGAARSFLEQIKQDYGNPEKRADAVGLPARPPISLPPLSSNLLEAIVRKVRSGEQSIGWGRRSFAVSIDTINAANAEMRREVHH
ncbi:MAG: ImmA/IrrE family metallo-endopeptidase [Alphaproteobacteria bacterium]